ncbi:MAG: tryptophan-rich sensory protein [Bacilli bacterium]|nr:tryptophan-rich sensory protein [Bacilli bacterium]
MNIKKLIWSIAIPIIMGIIVSLIMMPFNDYSSLNQPPLAPPGIAFPIVWTILYILMGISAYMVSENNGNLFTYYVQLVFNGLWSIIFFVFKFRLLAFIWIIILIILVIKMIREFLKVSKTAGYLQIPYLIWLLFAAYLNFGVYILN